MFMYFVFIIFSHILCEVAQLSPLKCDTSMFEKHQLFMSVEALFTRVVIDLSQQ